MKVLVAGFGNVLHGDDGFGIALLRRVEQRNGLPAGVSFLEVGIGGISVVQELMRGFDALLVLDAIEGADEAERAGTVRVLAMDVADLRDHAADATRDAFADIHYAEPGRALALAKAMDVLPATVYLIACVAASCELGQGLSAPVESALDEAEAAFARLVADLAA